MGHSDLLVTHTLHGITRFITQKLKLKVNETKSAVARPQERKLLGFSFSAGPEIKRMIAPKALDRFKQRIREITRKAKGVSMEKTIEELASYIRAGAVISASAKRLWCWST
jgi:RNA-directed DNA polymerase